ncbi:MAG: hypothetical protein L3J43_08200 [Sulfurovum sp.]|nr:hypothetical protein [Sulfurovum sp.]
MRTTIIKGIGIFLMSMLVIGCGSKNVKSNAPSAGISLSGKTVYIQGHSARFSRDSRIANNIKRECVIPRQLVTFIKQAGQKNGINVRVSSSVPTGAYILKVEITDAVSQGNAFIGHNKFTAISGRLSKAGRTIGSFRAARRSGGGFFGGYKSSCAVLARTVKALGEDVSRWMLRPTQGDELGDVGLIIR